MQSPSDYILVLAHQPQSVSPLALMLEHCRYLVAIAQSEEQVAAHTIQRPPFLIILAGDYQDWSKGLMRKLRAYANAHRVTLIALTDAYAASWIDQEENPGFDGFLVNPLSRDIIFSLVQSAHTRQNCAPVCT
jgi:AmiR/NasT family two-component response regulator